MSIHAMLPQHEINSMNLFCLKNVFFTISLRRVWQHQYDLHTKRIEMSRIALCTERDTLARNNKEAVTCSGGPRGGGANSRGGGANIRFC